MRRRIICVIFLLIVSAVAKATHIVGGEFEIVHIEGDRYLFRQIQYFDVVNGDPQAKDVLISASIFRKRDNVFVQSITMRLQSENYVPYTNPECTNDRLVTNRIVYSAEINLNPQLFSDPQGYYMVWERCCRNNIINNIIRPEETGQTFYIEFPPIRKDGQEFRNSSPQLFPPLSDYACVNRFYYVDFRGYDSDGDSLVYSLATPLNTSAFEPLPIPTPAPHPTVTWIPGINSNYQIPGNPTLEIDHQGFLTVTPSEEGLFVFSVRCEEYRAGIKIGTVIRDFQLFVIDCPDPGVPPEIQVKAPGSDVFTSSPDTVRLKLEDSKCFYFSVKDKDGSETITLRAVPINFDADLRDLFSTNIGFIKQPEDTLGIQFCLPDCPLLTGEPMVVDVIAQDFTCPLPLMDTIRLVVLVKPPPNRPPKFVRPVQKEITASFVEGSVINLSFEAVDDDLDSLLLFAVGDGFDLSQFGIEIDTLVFEHGKISFDINWNTDCQVYPFGIKNDFQLKLYVEDYDQCNIDNRDSITLNIHIDLPENNVPVVLVNNDNADKELTVYIEDNLLFDIRGFDADPTDNILLEAIGVGFDLKDFGIVFENQTGNSTVQTNLQWQITCDNVNLFLKDEYEILFIVEDDDKCKVPTADTVKLALTILPPINNAPEIFIDGAVLKDTIFVDAGQLLDLNIEGIDIDGDPISFNLLENAKASDLGIGFDQKIGNGNINSSFVWQTNCGLLENNFERGIYTFDILLNDYKCLVPLSDSLKLVIVVLDEEINYEMLPPNVFTPNNNDKINQTYYIPDLPGDNCAHQFEQIVIYNRWGKEVFSSKDRDFHWSGTDESNGVYYYMISYTDFFVKGTVSILR